MRVSAHKYVFAYACMFVCLRPHPYMFDRVQTYARAQVSMRAYCFYVYVCYAKRLNMLHGCLKAGHIR